MKTKNKKGSKQRFALKEYLNWKMLTSFGLGFSVIVGAFIYLAPGLSASGQNNRPVALQQDMKGTFFYNPDCSSCKKAYPAIFWHNFLNMANHKEQIQVVNVAYSANRHFISDFGIEKTPTMVTDKGHLTSSDGQKLVQFTEGGQDNG
ncbi:Thiol-disulfide isomerase or thioredoxin (TrxA) [Fructobacillus fructosus]|nr:Thiol-disulfide isomerase or thioredoxin (TrxA) [Fructobacillus fructosus]CAK1251540.1 Thiol-disulfide isomerase or thioredoxin (TrxA) [Fructobacillus fructosus]CAK1251652.1 Thiol-disulfide isomerase or thioredoxin (TrxA) [Fructobacillus fructosus]